MATTPRPGSMLAAEVKEGRKILLIFTVLTALVYLLFFIPFDVTSIVGYPHAYMMRAFSNTWAWPVLGLLSAVVAYWWDWKKFRDMEMAAGSKFSPALILFGWHFFNWILLSGFNFSLAGIEPGVTN